MKTVLLEILGFVLLCVCGTVIGGLLFMLYGACTSYVVGSQLNVFLPNTFLDGMLICFPPIMLFVPMLRMLSLVRHESKSKLFGLITLCVLSLATWVFCVPVCATAVKESKALEDKPASDLTAGYFRELDGQMNYFTSISGNQANGIKFENDYAQKNNSRRKIEFLRNEKIQNKRDIYGFSDPIVGTPLEPPTVLSKFFFGLISIEKRAFAACSSGVLGWLAFSSIMLALLAAGALLSVSVWRLVCMFWILVCTTATIILNYLYIEMYFSPFLSQMEYRGAVFSFIKNNFQPIMNGAILVVVVLAGVLCTILKNKNFIGDDL